MPTMVATKRAFDQRKKEIAKRIVNLQTKKGWTQKELAKNAALKDSYISRVLHAEANLTLNTIVLFEQVFGEPILIIPE